MNHAELIEAARLWLTKPRRRRTTGNRGASSVIVVTDLTTEAAETPDAIGWQSSNSTLIECKASRSDFLADKKKHFRIHPDMGMGDLRYFCTPPGLVEKDEVPSRWGLIEVKHDGSARVVKESEKFQSNKAAEVTMLISLLCRLRVETGRHVKIRAYSIDNGAEPRATVTMDCVRSGLEGLLDDLKGKPAEPSAEVDNDLAGELNLPEKRMNASEVLYGFCGWLTSRDKPITMSSRHNADEAAKAVEEFLAVNATDEPRPGWSENLTHPSPK